MKPLPIPLCPPATGVIYASTDPRVKLTPMPEPARKPKRRPRRKAQSTRPSSSAMTAAGRAYWLAELKWAAHLRRKAGRRSGRDVLELVRVKRDRLARSPEPEGDTECPKCEGRGKIGEETCPMCDGTGEVPSATDDDRSYTEVEELLLASWLPAVHASVAAK